MWGEFGNEKHGPRREDGTRSPKGGRPDASKRPSRVSRSPRRFPDGVEDYKSEGSGGTSLKEPRRPRHLVVVSQGLAEREGLRPEGRAREPSSLEEGPRRKPTLWQPPLRMVCQSEARR